jgi:uncharacterized membrane protein
MHTQRLEAFTDGVVAIIITIMVLELPVPREAGMDALKPSLVLFAAYALAVAAAFVWVPLSIAIYLAIAGMWLIPDKRFERME